MSTGEKLIRATQWQPLDGSTNNAAPGYAAVAGSQTQKIQVPVLQFDGAGSTVEYACYTTRVPVDYAAGGTFKILWMANSTSGTVKWQAQVGAVTPTDADTVLEHAWGAAATSTPSVNATEARRLIETSITLTMDSAAAGDAISFLISRDPANDTCTADAELISVAFQYTADDQAGSPLGFIGKGPRESDVTGISSSFVDYTGLSVTWTALANRYYKTTAYLPRFDETAATVGYVSAIITDGSNNQFQNEISGRVIGGSAFFKAISMSLVETLSAGSVTRKVRVATNAGTVTAIAGTTAPAFILVEDIGSSV